MTVAELFQKITADLAAGLTGRAIAAKYGIKRQTVSRIATGKQTTLRGPRATRVVPPARERVTDGNSFHRTAARRPCRVVRLSDGELLAGVADLGVARRLARVIGRDRCRVVVDGGGL